MLFERQFDEFDFEAFYRFLRSLGEKFAFHNILFTPDKLPLFTAEQLSHAAPNHELSDPNSFVGRWKNLQSEVRHVRFSYTSKIGTPSIEMEINLDRRSIGLIKVSGIECRVIDEILQLYFPKLQRLEGEPIPSPSCFISYSSADGDFAKRLHSDLQDHGVLCWFFPENAKWGGGVWQEIGRGIEGYDRLLVVCSEASLKSGPVNREIERALQKEDREGKPVLFPITLDRFFFDEWQHERKPDILAKVVGDFTDWKRPDSYRKAFERLLRDLKAPGVVG